MIVFICGWGYYGWFLFSSLCLTMFLDFLQWKYITSVTRIKNIILDKELWIKAQRPFLWLPSYNLMEADTVLCNIYWVISCLSFATVLLVAQIWTEIKVTKRAHSSRPTVVCTACQPCRREHLGEGCVAALWWPFLAVATSAPSALT